MHELVSILSRLGDVRMRGEIAWLCFADRLSDATSPPCCRCLQHLKEVRSGCHGGPVLLTATLTLDLSQDKLMELQVSLILMLYFGGG